jgi:hypothetical protein
MDGCKARVTSAAELLVINNPFGTWTAVGSNHREVPLIWRLMPVGILGQVDGKGAQP